MGEHHLAQVAQTPRGSSSRVMATFIQKKWGGGHLYSGKKVVSTGHLGRKSDLPFGISQPDTTLQEAFNALSILFPLLESLLVLPIGQTQPEGRGHWSLLM